MHFIRPWRAQIDPRHIILLFFAGPMCDQLLFGTGMKRPLQFVLACFGFFGADLIFNRIRLGRTVFPLSGLVSSFGTFLLIASPLNWVFALSGIIGAYSKHFITVNGRHVFNPVCFSSILVLTQMRENVQSGAGVWSNETWLWAYLAVTGFTLVTVAGRLVLCCGYLAAFAVFHYAILSDRLPINIYQLASPAFLLFTFYMISDPKTTPQSARSQILFAFGVAAVEALLKSQKIVHANLWGLFTLNVIYAVFLMSFKKSVPDATRSGVVWPIRRAIAK